ncbi:MAG: crotonase/enoyl-CoA hydratase family protein [Rhizobiaceae bacterium]|nr:crotonase/enoyl-CoA hydratase family protein [Rhizobiaceae bacterium]
MTYESTFFKTEIDNHVAHMIMSKGDKANAMSPDFWKDLPRIVDDMGKNTEIRALVISGEGRHFTGGMDLASFEPIMGLIANEPGRAAFALRENLLELQDTFNALERARFPVITAIHGACLGGGIDFITAADIRLASEDAYFGVEEIHIGMAADVGTLQRLPKLIAPGIAKELAYTGRRFSAQEALGWGLINSIHENQEAVVAAALQLAHEIAQKSPLAISGIKQSLNYARDHSVADSLDQIATWNAGMLRPEDLQKAIKAKMAKQEAVFASLLDMSA